MQKMVWMLLGACLPLAGQGLLAVAQEGEDKAAYLVVSGKYHADANLQDYFAVARPMADAAGMQVLAWQDTVTADAVYEGAWPHDGFVMIQKFPSMDALRTFRDSREYQAVMPLRQSQMKVNFVVAVEGR